MNPAVAENPRVVPSGVDPSGVHAEIHDRQQLEIRFDHEIGDGPRTQIYRMDAYLFVPRNVGVSRANYSRDQFYGDVTALMRIDAAPIPLGELASVDCRASPLRELAHALEALRSQPRPPPSRPIVVHVKLYAYLFTKAVDAEARALREVIAIAARSPRGSRERASLEGDTAAALGRMRGALWAFRSLRGSFWAFEELCHHSLAQALRNADEFMSLHLEERLAPLALLLDEEAGLVDGKGVAARVRLSLTTLADEEARYREKYGYVSLAGSTLARAEYFNYHVSLLKKAVHGALYLDVRASGGDAFLRNAVGAVGASLAAIWALAAQAPIAVMSLSGGTKAVVFLAAVLAYVLKDRIKALTNELLLRRLRKYDHASHLTAESLAAMGLGMLRIRVREAMSFKKSDELPPEVRDLRLSRRTVRQAEAATEEVIHYRKELVVGRRAGEEHIPEGFRVRDILRLNVRHFLVRLDDPLDEVAFLDRERGTFKTAQVPKVYHVNIVVRSERASASGHDEVRYDRLRLVLDKNGIVRVEDVESRRARATTLPGPAGR
jgi:hypothetical protein